MGWDRGDQTDMAVITPASRAVICLGPALRRFSA